MLNRENAILVKWGVFCTMLNIKSEMDWRFETWRQETYRQDT